MKLVQVYHTIGEKYNAGFSSFRSMIDYWNSALAIHRKNYDVVIYTDQAGYDKVSGLIDATFEIIDFEYIDDRYWNIGKFQVHLLQTTPYLMVDIDATLYDIVDELSTDVMTEMLRGGHYGLYSTKFGLNNIKKIGGIPCSGLLGFKDPSFAIEYATEAINKIKNTQLNIVEFETLWHIEEVFLANKIEDKNLTISVFEDFEHLQGGRK